MSVSPDSQVSPSLSFLIFWFATPYAGNAAADGILILLLWLILIPLGALGGLIRAMPSGRSAKDGPELGCSGNAPISGYVRVGGDSPGTLEQR